MIELIAGFALVAIVSFVLGHYFGERSGAQGAANLTMATVAMTAHLTYGEDWWEEFFEEIQRVNETERTSILALAQMLEEVQKK